ncbi:MAG: phosphopantetheine adenylyltransferase [Pseudomonadota bacterium]
MVAAIHLLPVTGAISAARLNVLYGISFDEPNLAILMRHRAVLFGLLGAFFACAAFRPSLQPAAILAGFISVGSFLFIAWTTGGYNHAINRIIVADLAALALLSVCAALYWLGNRH